jgi:hypothetical protein
VIHIFFDIFVIINTATPNGGWPLWIEMKNCKWLVLVWFLIIPTNISAPHHKVLLVIPGMGLNSNRTSIILSNLEFLFPANINNTTVSNVTATQIDCLIFVYKTLPVDLVSQLSLSCSLEYYYHGNYAFYLRGLVPQLLQQSGYTHVFVLLDDVRLSKYFNLNQILDIMDYDNLTIATPGTLPSHLPSLAFYLHRSLEGLYAFNPTSQEISSNIRSIRSCDRDFLYYLRPRQMVLLVEHPPAHCQCCWLGL